MTLFQKRHQRSLAKIKFPAFNTIRSCYFFDTYSIRDLALGPAMMKNRNGMTEMRELYLSEYTVCIVKQIN